MSFLSKMKHLPRNLMLHGTAPQHGVKGVLVDKGERYGAAFAFGYAKGYYGDAFVWKGHGIDMWAGVGSIVAAGVLHSLGKSRLASHLERVGDAGVMSALGSLGAAMGLKKAGRSVAVLSAGKNRTNLRGVDILGEIPAAQSGSYLSADDIARFAQRR